MELQNVEWDRSVERQRLVTLNLDDVASVRQCVELWLSDAARLTVTRPLVIRAFESLMEEVEETRKAVIVSRVAMRDVMDRLRMAQTDKARRLRRRSRKRSH